MNTINLIFSVVLILIGFVVEKNPHLIAGQSEDKTVITRKLKRSLILSGVIVIIGTLFFAFMDIEMGKIIMAISPMITIPLLLFQKGTTHILLLGVIVIVGTVLFFNYAQKDPKITISTKNIHISGLYGLNIPLRQVHSLTLVQEIPKIKYRTNGVSFNKINKGYFKMENGKTCTLFTKGNFKPFIEIITKTDDIIYINSPSKGMTEEVYKKIRKSLENE